jgi:hypothetical protein
VIGVSDRPATGIRAHIVAVFEKMQQFIDVYQNDKSARTIIHAILATNILLISIHILLSFASYFEIYRDTLFDRSLLVTTEGGYPEIFNYLQLAVLAWLMLHVFVRTRQAIYAALGVLFLLALGEDALQLHERVGRYAASIDLPAPPSLGAMHFGELLHWLGIGTLSVVALVYGLVASSAEDRKVGAVFVSLIFMLGFFAAVLDATNIVLRDRFFGAGFVLGIAEDGGEMLTIALAVGAAVLLYRHLDQLRQPPWRGVRDYESAGSPPLP